MVSTQTTAHTRGTLRSGDRDSALVIHDHLRSQILEGRLGAGSEINQAQVAAQFGISRGPVREAFRLLERDGLIDTKINHRARVAALSVDDLEHLYTLRVLNESLALSVSVPRLTPPELDEFAELADRLRAPNPRTFDFEAWDHVHQRFHLLLLTHSGPRMLDSAAGWMAHTQRYRRTYAEGGRGLPPGAAEHAQLTQLSRDRDAAGAARLLALHLSRAALTLIAQMAPTHEPVLLRAAIRQVAGPNGRG
jgi:DNA-binding GntR family transcriptional regulator